MKHPRVTEILKNFTNYEHIPQQILGRAAARGTSVHALCAGIAQGAWIPDGMIDEELVGYVNSFKKWSEVQVKSFLIIEERYTNEELKYSEELHIFLSALDCWHYFNKGKKNGRKRKPSVDNT